MDMILKVIVVLLILFFIFGPFYFYPKNASAFDKIFYILFIFAFTPLVGIPLYWFLARH